MWGYNIVNAINGKPGYNDFSPPITDFSPASNGYSLFEDQNLETVFWKSFTESYDENRRSRYND